jgi:peptide methionine sulfoxide reductase msrA/msrB
VSYDELLEIYRRQVDPTDAWWQFADRGYQYTTAIYYQTNDEQIIAQTSKEKIEASGVFDDPIAVSIVSFTSFYPAEEYHQDYYKKNASHYLRYKKWSGREDFIRETEKKLPITPKEETKNDNVDTSFLTPQQRHILFEWGTEPPFNNAYRDFHETGIYVDVIDGTPLFSSLDKFDSGTGWPSFTRPIDEALLGENVDTTLGMSRTEIVSASSSGHLWHVFDDWPLAQWGKRYCINSAALKFIPLKDMKNNAKYEKYIVLFE